MKHIKNPNYKSKQEVVEILNDLFNDYKKIKRVFDSCKTEGQLSTAISYASQWVLCGVHEYKLMPLTKKIPCFFEYLAGRYKYKEYIIRFFDLCSAEFNKIADQMAEKVYSTDGSIGYGDGSKKWAKETENYINTLNETIKEL